MESRLTHGESRAIFRVVTLISAEKVIKMAFNQWNASVQAIANVTDVIWALVLEPLPDVFYARAADSNALGLGDRTGPLVVAALSITWRNAQDDKLVSTTADKLLDAIAKEARQLGGLDPFIYLNYAGQFQDPIRSYGAESVSRLRQIQQKYDPKGALPNSHARSLSL